jgi:hypothetical protein
MRDMRLVAAIVLTFAATFLLSLALRADAPMQCSGVGTNCCPFACQNQFNGYSCTEAIPSVGSSAKTAARLAR